MANTEVENNVHVPVHKRWSMAGTTQIMIIRLLTQFLELYMVYWICGYINNQLHVRQPMDVI